MSICQTRIQVRYCCMQCCSSICLGFLLHFTPIGACADTPVHTQRSAIRTASAKVFRHCGSLSEATKNSRRQYRPPSCRSDRLCHRSPRHRRCLGTRSKHWHRSVLAGLLRLQTKHRLNVSAPMRLFGQRSVLVWDRGRIFACGRSVSWIQVPSLVVCGRPRGERGFRFDGTGYRRCTPATACGLRGSTARGLGSTCPSGLVFGNTWEALSAHLH